MALAREAAQSAAEARLLKTKNDLERRAEQLRMETEHEALQGQLIEYNLTTVDEGPPSLLLPHQGVSQCCWLSTLSLPMG